MRIFGLLILTLSLATAPARGQSPRQAFQALLDDHWAWVLEQNPTFATSLGVRDYDDRLGRLSLAAMDEALAKQQAFAKRLHAIDRQALTPADQLNYQLFERDLNMDIEAGGFGQRAMLFTTYYGWHSALSGLPDDLPFFTRADYESYVARLNDIPRYNAEGIATTRWAIAHGYVQPCAALEGFEKSIATHVVEKPEDSVFLKPFARQPATMADADWAALKAAAVKAIMTKVVPAYGEWLEVYIREYAPRCRASVGAAALPDGAAYYAHRIRALTTTGMNAEDIHALGLAEVARIRGEMEAVIAKTGFAGDFTDFQNFLRTDPRFYAATAEDLLAKASRIAKRIDGELPRLFRRLPRMPYGVRPVPEDIAEQTTTAYYERPAGDGSRAGVFRINTSRLDARPLFELEALTLHEAVPGHHLQIALAQELDLPNFRRFGGITAFVEGWALYAERLGLEMGFYEDPYSDFGRLSYEMWRAARLVVDTGIHAKGWTKQQAIDFMAANTALSRHNIEAEVNRYITWPGQALGYKLGELQIRGLRAKAEAALGDAFDVRAFHDKLLENGPLPLAVLEDVITCWLAAQENRQG
ncbi:MAG: DUF885 domain-containing protein [Pseudomonadota bacterium]